MKIIPPAAVSALSVFNNERYHAGYRLRSLMVKHRSVLVSYLSQGCIFMKIIPPCAAVTDLTNLTVTYVKQGIVSVD